MELVLTEAEKNAVTWSELDDESLGKVVKAMMFEIKFTSDDQEKLLLLSAAIILCSFVVKVNADTLTQTIGGLTVHGQSFGNWKVTIQNQNGK